jgi:E3 ubiquitin-protein ligase RNF213
VYNVYPLPESMFSFMWNYDKLDPCDEKEYVLRIIQAENDRRRSENIFTAEEVRDKLVPAVYNS